MHFYSTSFSPSLYISFFPYFFQSTHFSIPPPSIATKWVSSGSKIYKLSSIINDFKNHHFLHQTLGNYLNVKIWTMKFTWNETIWRQAFWAFVLVPLILICLPRGMLWYQCCHVKVLRCSTGHYRLKNSTMEKEILYEHYKKVLKLQKVRYVEGKISPSFLPLHPCLRPLFHIRIL